MTETLRSRFTKIGQQISARVLGQERVVERLLMALLADGHVLLQGPPGVAKTRSATLLAHAMRGQFTRIQFTPDLLPSDLIGSQIYDPGRQQFTFQAGPLLNDVVVADEINRAPAKVQAALLEAMAERQVTVAGKTHALSDTFFVIATQNPIEEEGTYELPVAQLDRFAIRIQMGYPSIEAEVQMLDLIIGERERHAIFEGISQLSRDELLAARSEVLQVNMSEPVKGYVVRLVAATRQPSLRGSAGATVNDQAHDPVAHPVSPRGSLALAHLARSHAWWHGRDFVTPDDVQAVCHDVLAHRLVLTHQAWVSGVSAEQVIDAVMDQVDAA